MHRQGSQFRGCNRVLPVFPESLKEEDGYRANENTTPNTHSLPLFSLTSSSALARKAAFSLTQRSHIRISYKYISPPGSEIECGIYNYRNICPDRRPLLFEQDPLLFIQCIPTLLGSDHVSQDVTDPDSV